jgi:hypothetical protein
MKSEIILKRVDDFQFIFNTGLDMFHIRFFVRERIGRRHSVLSQVSHFPLDLRILQAFNANTLKSFALSAYT